MAQGRGGYETDCGQGEEVREEAVEGEVVDGVGGEVVEGAERAVG